MSGLAEGEAGIRILHVDDDPIILATSKQILCCLNSGFEVDCAGSVDEALQKLSLCKYDVVISDYEMPQKTGLDLLRELRINGNSTPLIMFTEKGRERIAIKALNLGAAGYYDKHGNPETVYGELSHGIQAVVDYKRAQETAKKNELRYRLLADNSSDVIWTMDLEGHFTYVSPSVFRLRGYTPDEVCKQPISEALTASSAEIILSALSNNLRVYRETGKIASTSFFELEQPCKDGSTVWTEVNFSIITDKDGKPASILGLSRDITERKKSLASLEDKYQAMERVADSVNAGLVIIGRDYTVIWANERLRKIGLVPGRACYEAFGETSLCYNCGAKKIFDENAAFDTREYIPEGAFNREEAWVEIRATPIRGRDERVVAVLELAIPIGERKIAEQQLLDSHSKLEVANEKLKVVGGLTRHDVRNKLSLVNSNLYLLRKLIKDNPLALKYVDAIEQAAKASDKIFEFSTQYEKIGVEELVTVDVGEAFNQAIKNMPEVAKVSVINSAVGLLVNADSLLQQLFYNLVDNSFRHGEKVTEIKLHYRIDSKGTKLFYEDNGVGIPKANKDRIFADGFTTGHGSGLGLKLVRKMIEAYGWNIQEDGEEGKGARFIIIIPHS
jgi:PAS domain S-box-containing protein